MWVDDKAQPSEIAAAKANLAAARARLGRFYPALTARPKWLFCLSQTCAARFAKGARAFTWVDWFVFVTPRGNSVTVLTHEMAHAELHHRIGMIAFLRHRVPAWFDEGLAVWISRDTRFVDVQDGKVTGCTAKGLPEPPADPRLFLHLAGDRTRAVYTASACKAGAWLAAHGGASGVLEMAASIRSGAPFSP